MSEPDRRARRLLVIYNPTAGPRRRARLDAWLDALGRLGAVAVLRETLARGHAEALARGADPTAFDAVAAAGGDGTINEVVNGLAGSSLPLALLPLGTANVLANEIGLPSRPGALARIAAFGATRTVWPGEVLVPGAAAGWRFLLMAGIGFDAEVVEHVDPGLKRLTGKAAYVASVLGRLRDYRPRRYGASIDGLAVEPASLVVARSHFYGGRFVLAPEARLEVPVLHAVLFERSGRGAALRYMAEMVAGCLHRDRDVRRLTARSIELAGPAGAPVQIDGDIRARLPVSVRIAASPLGLIGP
jgi:diacylglycerol kinase (ATP)